MAFEREQNVNLKAFFKCNGVAFFNSCSQLTDTGMFLDHFFIVDNHPAK